MVKRLRRRPLTAKTGVRVPVGLPLSDPTFSSWVFCRDGGAVERARLEIVFTPIRVTRVQIPFSAPVIYSTHRTGVSNNFEKPSLSLAWNFGKAEVFPVFLAKIRQNLGTIWVRYGYAPVFSAVYPPRKVSIIARMSAYCRL